MEMRTISCEPIVKGVIGSSNSTICSPSFNWFGPGWGSPVVPSHILGDSGDLVVEDFDRSLKSEIYLATLNFKSMPSYLEDFVQIVMKRRGRVEREMAH